MEEYDPSSSGVSYSVLLMECSWGDDAEEDDEASEDGTGGAEEDTALWKEEGLVQMDDEALRKDEAGEVEQLHSSLEL